MRVLFLPYCVEQVEGHGHVVLNRYYKPLGISSGERIDYAPHAIRFKGLKAATASKLSWNQSADLSRIYLYNDGTIPTDSAANWASYAQRLAVLAKLKIER